MTEARAKDGALRFHLRVRGVDRTVTIPAARLDQGRGFARTIFREPFQKRTWSELGFFLISGFVACIGAVFILATLGAGVLLAVVFVGLLLIAASPSRHAEDRLLAPGSGPALPGRAHRRARSRSGPGLASSAGCGAPLRDWAGWRALGLRRRSRSRCSSSVSGSG